MSGAIKSSSRRRPGSIQIISNRKFKLQRSFNFEIKNQFPLERQRRTTKSKNHELKKRPASARTFLIPSHDNPHAQNTSDE